LEDLDMFGFRICLLVALVVATTSATSAEDYILPTGVTVLTEEQLLNQIIGSTIKSAREGWAEYYLPPSGDQKKGRFKGRYTYYGPTKGDWTVNGSLICRHYDSLVMVSFNRCFTTNLDGDTVTWYLPTGTPWYSRAGRIKLISGNPKNL
jgi:hypothetical protein